VATAGALEYPRWRFMITIMIARSLRYYIEGTLAVFYGERVLSFLKENGLLILGIVLVVCLAGLGIYFLRNRRRAGMESSRQETIDSSQETVDSSQ
jgi:membrane protein DedA with SNARE-associated domain